MPLPAIGSLIQAGPSARSGVVIGVQALGEPRGDRQLLAIKVKTSEQGYGVALSGGTDRDPQAPRFTGAKPALLVPQDSTQPRGYEDLDAQARAAVERLRQRDQQVRQEEQAHAAVAGDLAGPISYVYQRGPDGRLYAIGGSVQIEARSYSGDPQELARLGARLSAAAHAATNPSGADLSAAKLGYGLQADGERGERAAGQRIDLEA